jgi:hypothetical protein
MMVDENDRFSVRVKRLRLQARMHNIVCLIHGTGQIARSTHVV